MAAKLYKPFIIFLLIAFALSTFDYLAQEEKFSIKELLLKEVSKHPESEVEDIYKFLHQAAFGSEHAVKDTAGVRRWMEREIASLDYSQEDDLIDILSPDGNIVRINLRPFLSKGYDSEILLGAFIKTANSFKGSAENFKLFRESAAELAEEKRFSFTKEELNNFFEEQSKEGFPAIHHSEKYVEQYKPAYRVVDIKYLPLPENSLE